MKHYQVISPVITIYSFDPYEPPDKYQCWNYYLAKNAKDAIRQAVADEAFREWVEEQRTSNEPPFKSLKASLCLCEHGVCWACNNADERTNCEECEKAMQAEDDAIFWEEMG